MALPVRLDHLAQEGFLLFVIGHGEGSFACGDFAQVAIQVLQSFLNAAVSVGESRFREIFVRIRCFPVMD